MYELLLVSKSAFFCSHEHYVRLVQAPSRLLEVLGMVLVFWACDRPALAAVWPTQASSRVLTRPTFITHPADL